MEGNLTRRDALSLLGCVGATTLAGCAVPKANEQGDIVDLSELDGILEIPNGTTHTISTGIPETYDSILWGQDGSVELGTDATIELTEVSN